MTQDAATRAESTNSQLGTIQVSNVEELYEAVNEPTNAGKTIELKPGTYRLTRTDPDGAERKNQGRLELQKNMSLHGKFEHPSQCVITHSQDDPPGFLLSNTLRTGLIRAGHGTNRIAWLLLRVPSKAGPQPNSGAGSGIATDLDGTKETTVRIGYVIVRETMVDDSSHQSRGVDVRNTGNIVVNRQLTVEIEHCDFSGTKHGIRIANFVGANECKISVAMSSNRSHGNLAGCLITNNKTQSCSIDVKSHKDEFTDNGVGCAVFGANDSGTSNSTRLEATDLICRANSGMFDPGSGVAGGLVIRGASTTVANKASRDVVEVVLTNCNIEINQPPGNVVAHGAFSADLNGPAGQKNSASITLLGVNNFVVDATFSEPPENVCYVSP